LIADYISVITNAHWSCDRNKTRNWYKTHVHNILRGLFNIVLDH